MCTHNHTRKLLMAPITRRYRLNATAKGCTPAECRDHAITIKLERVDKIACTQLPGVCARIIRHANDSQSSQDHKPGAQPRDSGDKQGGNDAAGQQYVLLNTLHAKCESPVSSITRTLGRAEHASHLLVWGLYATDGEPAATAVPAGGATERDDVKEAGGGGGGLELACVDMIRLDAKFVVRKMSKAAGSSTPALFSEVLFFFLFELIVTHCTRLCRIICCVLECVS
jgi:hypothetical protein